MKQTLSCVGAAFLLLASQVDGHRSEAAAQEIAAGKVATVEVAASGDGGPPAAGKASSAPAETVNAAGLKLPATFKGTLPCADCEGIRYHLDLWADGVFHLRQTWLGTPGIEDDRGRWRKDPSRPVILLYGGREMPLQFEVQDPHTIRKLDMQGRSIASTLPYDLTSDGTLAPTDISREETYLKGD